MLLSPDTGARTRGDVLITGATGFLGMELMARLLEGSDRRVWALVRAPSQKAATEPAASDAVVACWATPSRTPIASRPSPATCSRPGSA